MRRCKKCILPENFPQISFDEQGVCCFCRNESGVPEVSAAEKQDKLADFERTVEACKGSGSDYDCLVTLSGGKDSTYIAYVMKEEYGLRVLTFTIDMGFMSKTALENVRHAVNKLDVDHVLFKPRQGFYNKLFGYLFTHMSAEGAVPSVCYVCGPVTDGMALKFAVEKGIPLILHGYGPNQPPDTRYFYEFPRPHLEGEGFSPSIFQNPPFDDRDRDVIWDYRRYKDHHASLPRVLMPLHVLDYDEDVVRRKVESLGLIQRGKSSPMATNCLLNWPMIYFQQKKLGYMPYLDFFSDLIREGRASRKKWLLMERIVSLQVKLGLFKRKEIRNVLKKLGITEEDIINHEWRKK